MNGTRIARNLSAGMVAAIAAAASYTHMRELAAANGQPGFIAAVLPLSVDGLMVVASVAMVDDKRASYRPRRSAWLAFVVGIVASVLANVLAAPPSPTARVISAWPALALLLVVEMLTRKPRRRLPIDVPPVAEVVDVTPAEPVADPWQHAEPIGPVTAPEPVADAKPRATRTRPKSLTSAEKVTRAAAKLPGAKPATIAAKAGVSESTARRYMPSPTGPVAAETTTNGHSFELASVDQ